MQSHFIKKVKKLDILVEKLLLNFPKTRDDDKLLILKVWAEQNPLMRTSQYSFIDFAHSFLNGEYADSESITRARRKLQEKEPNLRGAKWYERHDEANKVRKEIVRY